MSTFQAIKCDREGCKAYTVSEEARDWAPVLIRIGQAEPGKESVPFMRYEHMCPKCLDTLKSTLSVFNAKKATNGDKP